MKKYICESCNYTSSTNKNFYFTVKKINDKQVKVGSLCKKCKRKRNCKRNILKNWILLDSCNRRNSKAIDNKKQQLII